MADGESRLLSWAGVGAVPQERRGRGDWVPGPLPQSKSSIYRLPSVTPPCPGGSAPIGSRSLLAKLGESQLP